MVGVYRWWLAVTKAREMRTHCHSLRDSSPSPTTPRSIFFLLPPVPRHHPFNIDLLPSFVSTPQATKCMPYTIVEQQLSLIDAHVSCSTYDPLISNFRACGFVGNFPFESDVIRFFDSRVLPVYVQVYAAEGTHTSGQMLLRDGVPVSTGVDHHLDTNPFKRTLIQRPLRSILDRSRQRAVGQSTQYYPGRPTLLRAELLM